MQVISEKQHRRVGVFLFQGIHVGHQLNHLIHSVVHLRILSFTGAKVEDEPHNVVELVLVAVDLEAREEQVHMILVLEG